LRGRDEEPDFGLAVDPERGRDEEPDFDRAAEPEREGDEEPEECTLELPLPERDGAFAAGGRDRRSLEALL
jgi:hypothetical protein